MDLKTELNHMRGKSIRVNGTVYEIGLDATIRDIPEEDGEKVVKGKYWDLYILEDEEELKGTKEKIEDPVIDDNEEEEDGEDEGGSTESELEEMSMDELKKLADDLEISYGGNIGKQLLIERIIEAQE